MADLFSVHPRDLNLRATPSNWLDSTASTFVSFSLERTEGLSTLIEEEEESEIGSLFYVFPFRRTRFWKETDWFTRSDRSLDETKRS